MAYLILVPIIVLGYLLLVRPQQQRVRRQQQLLASIGVGDEVATAGGIIGRVSALEGDRVLLEVAPGVRMAFLRQAISRRLDHQEHVATSEAPAEAPDERGLAGGVPAAHPAGDDDRREPMGDTA